MEGFIDFSRLDSFLIYFSKHIIFKAVNYGRMVEAEKKLIVSEVTHT
jgi:hypothetical protein